MDVRDAASKPLADKASRLQRVVPLFLEEAGLEVAFEAKKTSPRRTGFLADSIGYKAGKQGVKIAPFGVSYAEFMEFGTRPHPIFPRNARVLAFEAGGMVFTRRVMHPGTTPRPFMARAAEASSSRLKDSLENLIVEAVE